MDNESIRNLNRLFLFLAKEAANRDVKEAELLFGLSSDEIELLKNADPLRIEKIVLSGFVQFRPRLILCQTERTGGDKRGLLDRIGSVLSVIQPTAGVASEGLA